MLAFVIISIDPKKIFLDALFQNIQEWLYITVKLLSIQECENLCECIVSK